MSEVLAQLAEVIVHEKDEFGVTKLHQAAVINSVELVKWLLLSGADIDARENKNRTPLHFAAKKNNGDSHFEVVEVLLSNGANVNAQDNDGQTPLFYLIQNGNAKIIQLLLNFNVDVNIVNKWGFTTLFLAVAYNPDVEVVQLLINLGLNSYTNDLDTPLHTACDTRIDNIKVIKCLLKNGADINAFDTILRQTPLMRAMSTLTCTKRHINMVTKKKLQFLYEHSDLNLINGDKTIFTCIWNAGQDYLWKSLIGFLVQLQSLDIPLHPAILAAISSREKFAAFFEQSQEELLRAKNTKLKDDSWITYYNLLVDDKKKIKNYAGNKDLMKDFKVRTWVNNFPIYGARMVENVKQGIKRREVFDRASIGLSYCLPIFNPNHLIVKDILDCVLSKKYLLKLCKNV